MTPRSSMAGVISSHCARHVRWVQGMRSLWPFWSFWSPAVTAVTYYDHEQAGCEDPVASRLPDPGFPGRDHLAVGAHRRRGGRLAGEPGARPAVGAALACDRRVGRQQRLDPAGAARRRPGGGDPADGRDHPPLDQRQLRGRDRRPGHPLLASERGLDRQAGRRGSRPGAGGSDVGRRAARHARGLRQGQGTHLRPGPGHRHGFGGIPGAATGRAFAGRAPRFRDQPAAVARDRGDRILGARLAVEAPDVRPRAVRDRGPAGGARSQPPGHP